MNEKSFILFCEKCGDEYAPNGFKEFYKLMREEFKCRKCKTGYYDEKKGE
jgi:hypothetical protein